MDLSTASTTVKERLVEELQKEKERLAGQGKSIVDHNLTTQYLKTGNKPANWRNYEILQAAVEDFETLCRDYDINTKA